MTITKYEHSCLDIHELSSRLVIDPGKFSKSFTSYESIDAVVITHVHPDHLDEQKVTEIVKANTQVQVFTTEEVATKLPALKITVPNIGQVYKVKNFSLEFFGGQHATIISEYPVAQNFGVLVNDKLYYPGDSFAQCPKPHKALAVPLMAPWMNTSEVAAFMKEDTAEIVFPAHDYFLNDDGKTLMNSLVRWVVESVNKKYTVLQTGHTLDV